MVFQKMVLIWQPIQGPSACLSESWGHTMCSSLVVEHLYAPCPQAPSGHGYLHQLHLTHFPKMKVKEPNTSTGKTLQPSANLRPAVEGAPG